MAFIEMNYRSKALGMDACLSIILPEAAKNSSEVGAPEGKFKTLYLLHGLKGDHKSWMRYTAIERYAAKYGIAVVMPAVARSWYTDTEYGMKYFTFITEEVPSVFRSYFKGASDKRADNYIGGLSMGGYGAVKTALTFPEKYAGVISLSGSLDITRRGRPYDLDEWRSIFDFDMKDAIELEGSDEDLFFLLKKCVENKCEIPSAYIWCGTEDSLLPANERFSAALSENGIKHVFKKSEGDHSWKWWDMHIASALEEMLG